MFCVWHDLRKNPKDLPTEDMQCVVKYMDSVLGMTYTVVPFMSDTSSFVTFVDVLAWTRLDEYDEDNGCSMSYLDEQIKGLRAWLNMHKVDEELAKKLKTLLYYLAGE